MRSFLRSLIIASIVLLQQVALAQVHDTTITFDSSKHTYKVSFATRLPQLQGRVNDFENDLTETAITRLDSLSKEHEQKTTDQIVIATIPNYDPYPDLAIYTTDLANKWALGQKDKNNGVLIVFSNNKHQVRIAVGFGLEKTLTDSVCKKLVDEVMIPNFRRGALIEGLAKGVEAIIAILENRKE